MLPQWVVIFCAGHNVVSYTSSLPCEHKNIVIIFFQFSFLFFSLMMGLWKASNRPPVMRTNHLFWEGANKEWRCNLCVWFLHVSVFSFWNLYRVFVCFSIVDCVENGWLGNINYLVVVRNIPIQRRTKKLIKL